MMQDLLDTTDDFVIWQPASVEIIKKSGNTSGNEERAIGGYCSTEHLDRQDEVVLQNGLDFSEFVQFGYFNDNHDQATGAVVGVPETAEYHEGRGWYTTGHLLKGYPRADDIWSLAKSLEGTRRRLGFSIEGKVVQRQGNKVVKAKIRNVAITNAPVNPNCTWDLLVKSFGDTSKALAAGNARVPTTGGRVLIPQDLEHDEVKDVWKCDHCDKAFRSSAGYQDHLHSAHGKSRKVLAKTVRKARPLNMLEAAKLVRSMHPEYSSRTLAKVVSFAFNRR